MKISICDDMEIELDKLASLCMEVDSLATINKYTSGQQLCADLDNGNNADIIILDVDMPQDNGITVGKRIRQSDSNVILIFYANHPQYAVESYDCDAFYYLMKDCPKEKFSTVLKKAYDKIKTNKKYITIQQRKTPRRILISDIYYIECVKKHLIYHIEGENIEISAKLSDTYNELKDLEFCHTHQGYIVNLGKINRIADGMIMMTNGDKVPISVRKRAGVIAQYADFIEKGT